MSQEELTSLTPFEQTLAKKYNLNQFFGHNTKFFSFACAVKDILENKFKEIRQSDWATSASIDLVQAILECCNQLFEHANSFQARTNDKTREATISIEDWERLCHISSKIIVHRGSV